jgi:Pro-kumamolisin, activation domain/Bacterial Ig-like domain (group 3)
MSKNSLSRSGSIILSALVASVVSIAIIRATAQQPTGAITRAIDNSERFTIVGSRPSRINTAVDSGRMDAGTELHGITLELRRSAAQETALKTLIAEQQNPASPLYHKWLTPDEFAARFGLANADLAKVEEWLQQQGFRIEEVSPGRTRIRFAGTVGQAESAFRTEIHRYRLASETHFAPSRDVSIPAALSAVVQNVSHLSNFRPQPRVRMVRPNFTSGQTGNTFLDPKDFATIYDVSNPEINPIFSTSNGYTGAGQSIAIVGQSAISLADIENFQKALSLDVKDPTTVLVPGSGSSVISSGDESESDLDLEYSGGIATGASIYFVYVGNNSNYDVWNSIEYAVDMDIAPIISTSYGICETAIKPEYGSLEGVLQQASAQGQSVIGPAGDTGSTDCYGVSGLTTTEQEALAVDYPASSAYVTAMGGSEFPNQDVCEPNYSCTTSSDYWISGNGSDVISSAKSYIPEQVWNDDSSANGLSSTGGGVSTLTPRPAWQKAGVNDIPTGGFRLVPDLSLSGSPVNAGYLFCSSDSSFTGINGSCSNGFRDSNDQYLTVAGGTSFDAPTFSGLAALINQKENSIGQGLLNPIIYNLASSSSIYASAFHDITSGGNQCTAGATYCSSAGAGEYAAGTGYDEASGLGSIDFNVLLGHWPASSTATLQPSLTTLSAESSSPAAGANDTITITVASGSSSSTITPTGTLTMLVDGSPVSPPPLSGATGAYIFSSSVTGAHVITATYSGDSTYANSGGTVVINVGGSTGNFTVSATNVTVSDGSSGTSTITVTPQAGYMGTISWNVSSSTTISNACDSLPNTTVSTSSPVAATLTVQTSSSACSGGSIALNTGQHRDGNVVVSLHDQPSLWRMLSLSFSPGIGVLVVGMCAYRPRRWHMVIGVVILAAIALLSQGCGGSSPVPIATSTTNAQLAPKGTYTLTIVGTDTSNSSITASTTVTLTVD